MPTATDAKTRVLDAAWTLVARRGSAEITMAELADEVGISRQAIYLHFPNRATLFLAMVQRFDQIHGDAAAREHRRALPATEAFEAGLQYWFKYLPQVYPVARALEAAALRSADGAEAWHDRMAVLRDSMAFYVARLADQGRLAEGWTVKEATDWVWSRVHPSVWRHLVEERGWRPTIASKRLVRSIVAELVSRRAR